MVEETWNNWNDTIENTYNAYDTYGLGLEVGAGLTSVTFTEALLNLTAVRSWSSFSLRKYSRELRAKAMMDVGSFS